MTVTIKSPERNLGTSVTDWYRGKGSSLENYIDGVGTNKKKEQSRD